MIKKILILLSIVICYINIQSFSYTYAYTWNYDTEVNVNSKTSWASNDRLDDIKTDNFLWNWTETWTSWIKDFIITIAKEVKNIFYIIAWIFFLIISIRFLFSSDAEEAFWKYKKWIIWITAWIFIMQISYSFVVSIYDQWLSGSLSNLLWNVVYPLISLVETMASIFFLFIAIYTFVRLVSSWWDQEKVKKWISSIIYAVIWILLIKFAWKLVEAIYWKYSISLYWTITITKETWFSSMTNMFLNFMNWLNWFVAIATIIMIIYAWVKIIFSNWDQEKVKKWYKLIIYAFIWILILVCSYLILTFFISPNWNNI